METFVLLTILLGGLGPLDEAADRAAIARAIDVLNGTERAAARPWSETTAPRYTIRSVRFTAPGVALVEAVSTQFGSMIGVLRMRVTIVMRRVGSDWKVSPG